MGACGSKDTDSDNPADVIAAILQPGTSVSNEAGLIDLQMNIKNKIQNASIQGETNIVSQQNLELRDISDGTIPDFYKKSVTEEKGPFGIFGRRENCPIFGCGYEISQNASYKVHSFNENLLQETETIISDIEQKMKQDASMNLEGNPSGLRAANDAINASRELVKTEVESQLTSLSNQNATNIQNMIIEYRGPATVRCKDPCGWDGGPYGPELSQDAQLEIISEQILNNVSNIYQEKFKEMGLEVEQSVEVTNTACILQMVISLVGCIICLIIVWQIIKMVGG
jgi:hypothetical protein